MRNAIRSLKAQLRSGQVQSDLLVIGTGIAGAAAALRAAEEGLSVVVLCKEKNLRESNTNYAQGGIAGLGDEDSPELLQSDIQRAGGELTNPEAVEILAREGPRLVDSLLVRKLRIPFSRDRRGRIDRTAEAAHSRRRIYHSTDATGRAIQTAFTQAIAAERNVLLCPDHMAIDLITIPHHSTDPLAVYEDLACLGAYALDVRTGNVRTFFAKKVLLATGGVGYLYLHTTNPRGATGDGLAMAARAGARIVNAEYLQFHPTALYHRDADRFLISEAVRGEGARLKTRAGEEFMARHDPERRDLAPRDVVARAIYEEISTGHDDYVLLDLSTIPRTVDVRTRFPNIYETCLRYGIDITREPIPVVPAAHYFCGGVLVDEWGRTNLRNLYAAGEVSCTGLHGANRLASTSLLEGLLWGHRSALHAVKTLPERLEHDLRRIPPWRGVKTRERVDPVLISQDLLTIRTTMWNYVGIVRTEKRLQRAKADLEYLSHRIERFYTEMRLTRQLVELRNAILVALVITNAALQNRVSRGCHYRVD
jgi:L-aspartate oxidase